MGQQQCESNRMRGHHQSYIFRSIQRIQIQLVHHQKRQQESWMDWTWQPRVMKASFFSISVWKRYLQYLLYDFTKQCHCKLFSQKTNSLDFVNLIRLSYDWRRGEITTLSDWWLISSSNKKNGANHFYVIEPSLDCFVYLLIVINRSNTTEGKRYLRYFHNGNFRKAVFL